jgi:hypothetical protein
MWGLFLTLCFVVVAGQRPWSTSSEVMCQTSKPPLGAVLFSFVLDQVGEDVFCEPFLFGVVAAMGNDMEMKQLGLSFFFFWFALLTWVPVISGVVNVTRTPLRMALYWLAT